MINEKHKQHLRDRGHNYTDKTIKHFGLNSGTWHKAEVIFYNFQGVKGYLEIKPGSKWRKLKDHHITIMGDYWPKQLILCEGEHDLFRAYQEGIKGACSFTGGASSIPARERLGVLRHKNLVIIFDQDKAGRQGAERVAGELYKSELYKIGWIKKIDLPVDQGKDLTDYFNEGHTAEELQDLIDLTTPLTHPNYKEQYNLIEKYRDKIYKDQSIKRSKRDKVYTMADYIIRRANIYTGEFSDSFSQIGQRWDMSRLAIIDLWKRTFKAWGLLDWKGSPGRNEQTTFKVKEYPKVKFQAQDRRKQEN